MVTSNATLVIFLVWFLSAAIFQLSLCCGGHVCNEKEKEALLSFKQGLTDPSNRLSTWSAHQDCCQWAGVHCNNVTGRVTELHLRNPTYDSDHKLGGKIAPSLLQLQALSYLDLSWNDFGGSNVPSFLGSLASLRYLNLTYAGFEGLIPPQLGNLSGLLYLGLGYNGGLYVDDLSWISHLYSLEYLDMCEIDLGKTADHWLQEVSMLPSISKLSLWSCQLGQLIPPLSYDNFTSLKALDLSDNLFNCNIPNWLFNLSDGLSFLSLEGSRHLTGHIPDWIGKLKHLEYLSLGWNSLSGPIPASLGNLSSLRTLILDDSQFNGALPTSIGSLSNLEYLSLGMNSLSGPIPASLGNLLSLRILDLRSNQLSGALPISIDSLSNLEYLRLSWNSFSGPIPASFENLSSLGRLILSGNQLNGTLPTSISYLSNLEELRIDHNSIAGTISEVNFAHLSKLKILDLSSNSFSMDMSSNWVPPFQLQYLSLSSCKMSHPEFPQWLRSQTFLQQLDLSQMGISGTAPDWFWKLASGIEAVYISGNQMNGDLSNIWINSTAMDINSNCFEGQLPVLSPNVQMLNLANNSLSGNISTFLCQKMKGRSKLELLDLSNNQLTGGLPNCWRHWQSLTHLNLGGNSLSGKIPNSIGSLAALESLQLHSNFFFGEVPLSLQSCKSLGLINLGGNAFTGPIPKWIGEITTLLVLQLKSNKFTSNIPSQICQLSQLQILDLANNNLLGPIPNCLNNISALSTIQTSEFDTWSLVLEYLSYFVNYEETLRLVTKGREYEYGKGILKLVRSIDLSDNNLSGQIPNGISKLHGLRYLNLSHNQLIGTMPEKIGDMTTLESLDLSRNHLFGEIPQSMSYMTSLNHLDLSYNNFSGKIPSSTQLQSQNATGFIGNAQLCGPPLNQSCTEEERPQGETPVTRDGDENEVWWFYVSMGPGFAVGFWCVCGTLLLKRSWRKAYFQFLDNFKDKIHVYILLKKNWICKKFESFKDV